MVGKAHGQPAPLYPGEAGFAETLDEVIQVRRSVELRQWPTEYLSKEHPVDSSLGAETPVLLRNLGISKRRPSTAAEAVRMDDVTDLGIELFHALRDQGAVLATVADGYGHFPFVESYAAFVADLGMASLYALKNIFEVKSHFGLERPETVLNLPGCIVTGDEYGAPNHFSYGAGHGAVAGATEVVINKYFRLTDEQKALVKDAVYQFAHWRTLLGVHYRQDNDCGIRVGAEAATAYLVNSIVSALVA